ncbi:hypothetical protein [Vibrio mimicus]|uniref:hypothetical protein n=1 Tax=Vibrio mimicus TaxID=674 RepID=UPI0001BAC86E|nr:hypothetical protein [Vibrio mimicus]EEY36932.1 hypothetical protein VII_000677 [Vibrio mimicus MB451]
MAILKRTKISHIQNVLDNGKYCLEDFETIFPAQGSVLAEIKFKAYPSFHLSIYEDTSNAMGAFALLSDPNKEIKTVIKCSMSPGEYKTEQVTRYDSIDNAISEIYSWVDNIKEELTALRSTRQHAEDDDVLSNFQEYLDEPVDEPESFFSAHEAQALKDKLEELQKRVEQLEADKQIEPEDCESLTSAIESTKSDIDVYPKGVWYRTAGNKILKTLKRVAKNKESRDLVIDVMKKLMESGT